MKARQIKFAALAVALQCILVLGVVLFHQSGWGRLASITAAGFWGVPFVVYLTALYSSSFLSGEGPISRTILATFFSIAATLVSGVAIFFCLPLVGIRTMH
jgi:hypothetical protein